MDLIRLYRSRLFTFRPCLFTIRFIVDAEGILSSENPSLFIRYWIVSAPTPRYLDSCSLPSIKAFLMLTITLSISSFVFFPCCLGVLDLDLYHSSSPVLNRFTQPMSHFFDLFASLQISTDLSPFKCRFTASILSCSSISITHHRRCVYRIAYQKRVRCIDPFQLRACPLNLVACFPQNLGIPRWTTGSQRPLERSRSS